MRITITLLTFLFCSAVLFAQNNIWGTANSFADSEIKERVHTPNAYRTVSFNADNFLTAAQYAPSRTAAPESLSTPSNIMQFPMPDGGFQSFYIIDAELMHPDLTAAFPELKSYLGKGIDDPTADIRITYSPQFGFNGMIKSGEHSTVYIDPLTTDNVNYMIYYRNEIDKIQSNFACHTPDPDMPIGARTDGTAELLPLGDCNLRRYRLALSCNGEYAQYHIAAAGGSTGTTAGDKAIVQAAMNVTMARVNGVYERDLGITLQIIPNNDLIIYLNAATDPWSGEYNTTTAQTIDAVIGVANYDIGHNFNTSGGGSAGCLDCVCLSVNQAGTHKGRGYTGLPNPIGDPFDIDYVAHEMGHQFGGYHVQSNQSCRSGSGATEVEPGSASTIMGYAGICAANVQTQSDDYFAYVNIRDIVTSINGGNASGCAELIISGNAGPTANAGPDYTIPISTPFKLQGTGSDPDDTGLTYCWEQNDPENPSSNASPPTTRTVGPMFRSLDPVPEDYRYMPNLPDIISNVSPTWEVLPSVSRNMEFSFTVRDNNVNSGCTDSDLMSVSTSASAGPFVVTTPNTSGIVWSAGATETITWNVAGTDNAPVSCANVDILMSTDGGNTYPITLATSVPNDGSHDISVPNNPGTMVRIMVVCSDNIFFDISNFNLEIEVTGPDFTLSASPATVSVCVPDDANYTVNIAGLGGYTDNVNLTASGLPTGATASFSPNPVVGGTGASTLTITTTGVTPGTYTITIQAAGTVGIKNTTVDLIVLAGPPSVVTLVSPANGATAVSTSPLLSWNPSPNAVTYEVEVATDGAFTSIVYTGTGITATSTTVTGLATNTIYFWRVRAVNPCGTTAWSTIWNFTTQDISPCLSYAAGPYINFKNAPCASACGIPITLAFEVYANESYLVYNVTGGAEYTFEFCTGYSSATWDANITVAYYDGTTATTNILTTAGCSATFTPPTDGDIILIIWTDPCGSAEIATDNGVPTFMCTGNGAVPDCPCDMTEDFEGGQPTDWFFGNNWTVDAGCIGGGTAGCNSGTGNWLYFDDDAAGSGSTNDVATATSPYFNLSNACNVTLSFDYTYREYNPAPQEFVQLRVFDGTQWQYWDGAAWTTTATNWLSTATASGTFNEVIPVGFYNGAFQVEFTYSDNGGWEYGFGIDNFVLQNDCPCLAGILLAPKVFLQGPLTGTTMTTALTGMLPTTSPYTDSKPLGGSAPANTVDWVWVEVRSDATASPTTTYGQSALLLDNGDVVDTDGTPLSFLSVTPGTAWYVVVKHRNHLGMMTATAVILN